jgi:hypothetical protein
MKRGSGHQSEGVGSGDERSTNNANKRSRRRRRGTHQMIDNNVTIIQNSVQRAYAADASLSSSATMQRISTGSIHSIDTLGENVNLPDYVREHNSTLTFPEKVRIKFIIV